MWGGSPPPWYHPGQKRKGQINKGKLTHYCRRPLAPLLTPPIEYKGVGGESPTLPYSHVSSTLGCKRQANGGWQLRSSQRQMIAEKQLRWQKETNAARESPRGPLMCFFFLGLGHTHIEPNQAVGCQFRLGTVASWNTRHKIRYSSDSPYLTISNMDSNQIGIYFTIILLGNETINIYVYATKENAL